MVEIRKKCQNILLFYNKTLSLQNKNEHNTSIPVYWPRIYPDEALIKAMETGNGNR